MNNLKVILFDTNTINDYAGRTNSLFNLKCRELFGWKLVGSGYPDHPDGNKTADEIIKKEEPDWVFGMGDYVSQSPVIRECKLPVKKVERTHDLHVAPNEYIKFANKYLDLWLMRSQYTKYVFPTYKEFWAVCEKPGTGLDDWVKRDLCYRIEKRYLLDKIKIKNAFFPNSIEPAFYKPSEEKIYDVSLIASVGNFYPLRLQIYNELPSLAKEKGWNVLIKTSPPSEYRKDTRKILSSDGLRKKWFVREDYADITAKSKIFIFDCGFAGYPVTKFFEAMACRTLAMSDEPFHEKELHFEKDQNYVEIDKYDWKEKIEYYLESDQLRETISSSGYDTVMKYHTNEVRAKDLYKILEKNKNVN